MLDYRSKPLYEKQDRGYDTPCWVWQWSLGGGGYGQAMVGRTLVRAHREFYEAVVGPIPPGHDIHHRCRVRACINPDHLEPLSRKDHRNGHAPEACRLGHPLVRVGVNLRCRVCDAANAREYRRRKREAA
jgi:hypothetical protein